MRGVIGMVGVQLAAACAGPARPPNLILVSMDTVRADRCSGGSARDTTPNLAALAAQGVSWSQAYAVGNESVYSHAAIFSGRYPSELAVPDYSSFVLPDSADSLPEVLRAYGYATAAFTGGGHVVGAFGFDQGFDVFSAEAGDIQFGSFFESVPAALHWMSQPRDQPYFVFVHGYDAHSPYQQRGVFHHTWDPEGETPHSEELAHDALALEQLRGPRWFPGRSPRDFVHAAGRRILSTDFYRLPATPAAGESVIELSPGEVEHIRAHYDAGLTYADHWLGVLLSEVDLDETLVVVLADHGEDLLDHGFINHRAGLWDSTLHVPLVVAGPGFRGGRMESGRVDLRSVLPTLLLAAGAPPPAGVSAKPLQENPALPYVFAEGVMDMVSVRGPRGRLCLDNAGLTRGNPPIAPRSLDSGDFTFFFEPAPDDLIPKNIARPDAEELKRALAEWRQHLPQGPALPGTTDPALRSALQERGYWEPETEPSPDGLAPTGAPPAGPSTP